MLRAWAILAIGLVLGGCAHVNNLAYVAAREYPKKAPDAHLDVYFLTPAATEISQAHGLDRDYEIIASFNVWQDGPLGNLQETAMMKAREIGGDGIVYQHHPPSGGSSSSTASVWVLRYLR